MTKIIGTMVMFLLAWPGEPAADPPVVKQADYYPLRVGNKWKFQMEVNGVNVAGSYEVAKIDQINGQALARIEVTLNGKATPTTEHLAISDKGIFRHRVNGMEMTPPVCLLKYPVKLGETWTGKTKSAGEELDYTCRVGKWENVEVPAGKFKAITLNISLVQGGKTIVSDYWFAAGVGIVKQEFDIAGVKGSMKLEKFEEAKAEKR